jgi:hypothetical protein
MKGLTTMEKNSKVNSDMKHLKERWHIQFREDEQAYVIRDTSGFNVLRVCLFLPGDIDGKLTAEYLVSQHNASLLSDTERQQLKTATARIELPNKKGDVCRGVYIVDGPDGGVYYLNKDGAWHHGASDAGCWWDNITQATDFLKNIRKEYEIDGAE